MSFAWMPRPRRAGNRRRNLVPPLGRAVPGRHRLLPGVPETLEDRTLLNAPSATPTGQGLVPNQISTAYGFNAINVAGIAGTGQGQTVAIVETGNQPNLAGDLTAFDTQFGLPAPPSLQILNQTGLLGPYVNDVAGVGDLAGIGESEDVEYFHALAPQANIILVEADSATAANYMTATNTARNLPGVSVVVLNYELPEAATELAQDATFTTPAGHTPETFIAPAGSNGSASYPGTSPNVLATGGTRLTLNPDNTIFQEAAGNLAGGGVSAFEPQPSYQSMLPYPNRAVPDVAFVNDTNSVLAVYDSYDDGATTPWTGLTGFGVPDSGWAALVAITNQERLAHGDPALGGTTNAIVPLLYGLPSSDFNDVTQGNNGHPAGPGFDLATGLGTPIASQLVAALTPLPVNVTAAPPTGLTEGLAFTNVQVATFTDTSGTYPATAYSAAIDWGDGTATTPGTVVDLGGGVFGVDGSHTYAEEKTYPLTVSVINPASLAGQGTAQVTVGDAPLSVGTYTTPVTPSPVVGQPFTGVVGTFVDANANAPLSDFSAMIDWGDGVTSTASFKAQGGGVFQVIGSHTYKLATTEPISFTVTDVGGSSTPLILNTAVVQDVGLTPIPRTFNAVAGAPFSTTIASFTDPNLSALASDFSATVDWGDGKGTVPLPAGSVVKVGTRFDVVAGTTYAAYGTKSVVVTVTDVGTTTPVVNGSSVKIDSTANVADAPILTATAVPVRATEGQLFNGTVATFTSANPNAQATDFQTPVITWGDGTSTSTGTITALGNGKFTVTGSHTYQSTGTFTDSLTVSSQGPAKPAPVSGKATVTAAALTVTVLPQTGVSGQPLIGPFASFVSQNTVASAANFTATINWGDNTTSPGVITQPGGVGKPFLVGGSHTYAAGSTYPITVTVNDAGGSSGSQTTQAVISDPTFGIKASPLPLLQEGNPVIGTVAVLNTGNPQAVPQNYLASINFGDGTFSQGTLTNQGGGVFTVAPKTPHAYNTTGTFPVTVTVVSELGVTQSSTVNVTVGTAPITGVATAPLVVAAGTTFTGTVASFTQFAGTPASSFSATITWGDGSATAGTVSAGPNGTFLVSGTHLYKIAGTYTTQVAVSDATDSATLTGSVQAADPALNAAALPIAAAVNVPFTGTVATMTEPNVYDTAGEFKAIIYWGDLTPASLGVVTGSSGKFTVTGSHTFTSLAPSLPVTITIFHNPGGSSASLQSSATVSGLLTGGLSPASDTGVSNHDGITAVANPVYLGTADAGSTVVLYAEPMANPASLLKLGSATTDATGHWSVQISPLPTGSYKVLATMTDAGTTSTSQTVLAPLVIATSGPTVSSVALDPSLGTLHVIFQTTPASMSLAGLFNAGNYVLDKVASSGALQPLTPTAITGSAIANGQVEMNITYSGAATANGTFVVTLRSAALTDLAGNILVEQHFVTYPQTTNAPNPNYVAQINVVNGAASAPAVYVPQSTPTPTPTAGGNTLATPVGVIVVRVPSPRITGFFRRR